MGPLKALAVVLARLAISNSRDVADLIGACFSCFLLPATNAVILAMQEAGKIFAPPLG